jgi:membrane protease YdiL (CAAX protease family)
MKQSLKHFVVFIAWNIAISVILLFSVRPTVGTVYAGAGLAMMLVVALGVIYIYLLRKGFSDEGERAAELRLTPLRGSTLKWTLVAAPVLLLFSWSFGEVYVRLVPVPAEALDPYSQVFLNPRGRLMLAILAVGLAPILEELFFRGLIQRSLERKWGIAGGILGASALFALVHFMPWIFPLHFVLGAAFGYVVVATRSIWSGVLLHAANNTAALVGHGLERGEMPVILTVWDAGPDLDFGLNVALLLVSFAAAIWVARRMWDAGRNVSVPAPYEGVVQ